MSMRRYLCRILGHRWVYQNGKIVPLRRCAACGLHEKYQRVQDGERFLPGSWAKY